MKALGYIRVSTEEQAEHGVSLDAQRERLTSYCKLYNIELAEVVVDAGYSAKNLNRPGMQRILGMIRKREVGAIVTVKLDRLTRSVRDLADLVEIANKHEVALVSVQEHLDTSSAAGRMILNMLSTVSQWEREAIGERTATALQYKKRSGQRYSREAPYGFEHLAGAIVPNETEQAIVDLIGQLRAMERGYTYIASYLNENGYTTRSGGKWFAQQVKRVVEGAKSRECIGTLARA